MCELWAELAMPQACPAPGLRKNAGLNGRLAGLAHGAVERASFVDATTSGIAPAPKAPTGDDDGVVLLPFSGFQGGMVGIISPLPSSLLQPPDTSGADFAAPQPQKNPKATLSVHQCAPPCHHTG